MNNRCYKRLDSSRHGIHPDSLTEAAPYPCGPRQTHHHKFNMKTGNTTLIRNTRG